MTFKTTLFTAIRAADLALCNGQRLAARHLEQGSLLAPYVVLADDTSLELDNQEIQIDQEGRAYCHAKVRDDKSEPLVWTFQKMQPLRIVDLPDQELSIDDVRKALGAPAPSVVRSRGR